MKLGTGVRDTLFFVAGRGASARTSRAMALSVAPPPAGLRPKLGNFVKSSTGVKGLHHAACTYQSSSTADSGVAGAELSLFLTIFRCPQTAARTRRRRGSSMRTSSGSRWSTRSISR